MKRILLVIAAVLVGILALGAAQDYFNNPLRGCPVTYRDAHYTEWTCEATHYYQTN